MKIIFILLIAIQSICVSGMTVHIAKYRGDKTCAVTLTFDDGIKEHATMVLPELMKRHLKATFGIIGGRVGGEFKHATLASWDNIRMICNNGQEIASHGWLHRNMTKLSPSELQQEIALNDSIIIANTGKRPLTIILPYNAKSSEILHIACKNKIGARMFQVALGYGKSHVTEEKIHKWIEKTKKERSWLITMTHGITVGYDAFGDNTQVLWNFFDLLKSQEDNIWIGTLAQVAAYNAERDNLKLNTIAKDGKIIITPYLSLNQSLYHELLTIVIDNINPHIMVIKQNMTSLKIYKRHGKYMFDINPWGGNIEIKTNSIDKI